MFHLTNQDDEPTDEDFIYWHIITSPRSEIIADAMNRLIESLEKLGNKKTDHH